MSEGGVPKPLPGDNPIRDSGQDVLQRAAGAATFARQVLDLDASQGAAVGVFGPWGSGKTSFVNLARKTFDDSGTPVLDFNPWLFSGTEQLVERFFTELSAQMEERGDLENVVAAIGKYGNAVSGLAGILANLLGGPLAGQSASELLKAIGDLAHPPESVNRLRDNVVRALEERDKPIVVVLDDVDRLSSPEVRDVFKLVRLTASFPNLVYIVACDRLRVERALGEQEMPGRDYLEKIIQWSFDLPEIPNHVLAQQLPGAIENALADIEDPGPFDEQAWPDIHVEIVRPLIRNMRDVRRYAVAIRQTVAGLDGKVALADVLGLEAVRVFLPDVFRRLPGAIDGLTVMTQESERYLDRHIHEDPMTLLTGFNAWHKAQIEALISAAEREEESEAVRTARGVVEAMIDRLFPVGAQLRQLSDGDSTPYVSEEEAAEHLSEQRVAHANVLRLYLERTVSPELLAFHDAERALARMADLDGLNGFIRSLDPARWQDVLSNLCRLEDRFRPEHVEPGVIVSLNLWPDMLERSSGLGFLDDTIGTVRKITLRLLRALEDAAAIEVAMRRILPKVTSFSAKVELVLLIGYRQDTGHKLVSETAAHEFETMLGEQIRSASTDDFAREHRLWRVLYFAKDTLEPSEEALDIDNSPKLAFALLRSARGETITGSSGSRAVSRSPTLMWDVLVDLYGSETVLNERIEHLAEQREALKPWFERRGIAFHDAESVIELAQKYAGGWQPE